MTLPILHPNAKPEKGSRVHLMLTCLCDAFYPQAGIAVVECLEAAGYPVVFDPRQTCCGQPAFNAGDRTAARQVARHTLEVFRNAQAVVVPSGSCAAMIRWGYPQLFEGERDLDAALALGARTYEFHEFLVKVAGMLPWPGRYARRVALHTSCHMRELQTGPVAESLLRSVAGIDLRPVPQPEQCCGFGGTFSVKFPWTSREIGIAKLDALQNANVEELVSTDMGCLMHLAGLQSRLQTKKPQLPMRHVAELLRDSLQENGRS